MTVKMTRHRLAEKLRAEADLAWLFEVAPTLLEVAAMDLSKVHIARQGWEYSDRQIDAVSRARPLRAALAQLERRQRTALRLRFEPRTYRNEAAKRYLIEFGPQLAAVVMHFGRRWRSDERHVRAELLVAQSLTAFCRARAFMRHRS